MTSPRMSGIRRSMSMTSTCSLRMMVSADSPDCAAMASYPDRESAMDSALQIDGSSSTTSTRICLPCAIGSFACVCGPGARDPIAPPADDPGTTFHILLPSPAPHLLAEQRDERFLGDFPPHLFRRPSSDLTQLLRQLPRRVIARLRRDVFDRPPWVLQECVCAKQPR